MTTDNHLELVLESQERYEAAVEQYRLDPSIATADSCDRAALALAWAWKRTKWHHQRGMRQTEQNNSY